MYAVETDDFEVLSAQYLDGLIEAAHEMLPEQKPFVKDIENFINDPHRSNRLCLVYGGHVSGKTVAIEHALYSYVNEELGFNIFNVAYIRIKHIHDEVVKSLVDFINSSKYKIFVIEDVTIIENFIVRSKLFLNIKRHVKIILTSYHTLTSVKVIQESQSKILGINSSEHYTYRSHRDDGIKPLDAFCWEIDENIWYTIESNKDTYQTDAEFNSLAELKQAELRFCIFYLILEEVIKYSNLEINKNRLLHKILLLVGNTPGMFNVVNKGEASRYNDLWNYVEVDTYGLSENKELLTLINKTLKIMGIDLTKDVQSYEHLRTWLM